ELVARAASYLRHFYPAIARVKAILASGEVGDPVLAQIDAFEQFKPSADSPRAWLLRKAESGGGPMMDFGCHRLEVLLNVFGPVQRVTSLVSSAILGREVEDTVIASLQFARGPCATVTVTHAAHQPGDAVSVFATRGSLHVNSLNTGELVVTGNRSQRTESHPPAANIHQPLVQDFVDAVLSGRAPGVGGDIGRAVAQLEEEIYSGGVS